MKQFFTFCLLFITTVVFPQAKKLLLIGIDGCRSDAINSRIAPAMDSLIKKANTAFTYSMKIEKRTISAPNWTSMPTGVHCSKHRARKNSFRSNRISQFPHFFKYLEAKDSTLKTYSFPHWMPINKYIVNGNADQAPVLKEEPSDEQVRQQAIEWLQMKHAADVIFIHFDDADHNGHRYGFNPENKKYANAVSSIDKHINAILNEVRKREQQYNEEWLVMISTDHGGRKSGGGGHGGGTFNPKIQQVFLIINGNQAIPGEIKNAETIDVAYTALKYFNVDIQDSWKLQGKSVGLKEELPVARQQSPSK